MNHTTNKYKLIIMNYYVYILLNHYNTLYVYIMFVLIMFNTYHVYILFNYIQ